MAVSKLDKAKASIVLDHPFFASILLRRKMVARTDIPILAINQLGTIYYNPTAIEGLSVQEIVWGLCHECMHYMGQHANRQQQREHKKWNHATDAWINDTLTSANIGTTIAGCVDMAGSKDKSCEAIYDELPDAPEGEGGGGSGDGQGDSPGQGMSDDIMIEGKPLSESEANEAADHAKIEVAEAAQAAKMRGKMPGALANFVADFLESKTPWHEILERHMTNMSAKDQSWMRPNRRFIPGGMYLPSRAKKATMGPLVVQVDVSGSISQEELAAYNGHLSRIVEQTSPESVDVIYTDTQVQKHVHFEQGEPVGLEFYSGGGTHMPAGFDWIAENGIDPQVLVTLTDGYTGFDQDPGYPTIWCISSDIVAPYGETVHFSLHD